MTNAFVPGGVGGAGYNLEGLVGPQGIPGINGVDGNTTILHLQGAPNSSFLTALPHNIDLINQLGTAADKLIYTDALNTFGGSTNWTERQPAGAADKYWTAVASDADGSNLIACVGVGASGRLYTSADYGVNWTERRPAGDNDKDWTAVASDSDGSHLIACATSGRLYTSNNYGASWTERQPAGNNDKGWSSVASDDDGSNLIACVLNGRLYTSSNYGVNWTERQPDDADDNYWTSVASDDDGSVLIAGKGNTATAALYISVNSGVNWSEEIPAAATTSWFGTASDADGSHLVAGADKGRLAISADSGNSWALKGASGGDYWHGVSTNSDGSYIIVCSALPSGNLYESFDSGATFVATKPAGATTKNWRTVATAKEGSSTIVAVYGGRLYTGSISVGYSEATWAESDLTSAGRAILDDATAGDQRTTLGVGTGDSPTWVGATFSGLTASRLTSTDGAKALASVGDLTAWIAGTTDHISVADDGDGTVTLDFDTNTQTLLGSFNGIFLEKLAFTITEAGGTVTGSLEQDTGGDLIQKFSDGYTTLDCTPAKTIDLTAYVGTDAVPKEVFIYILQSAKTAIVASNVDWPLDPELEHIKIAHLVLKSAATTGTDGGALMNQNHNDYAFDATGEGHLQDIEHRLRQEPAQYHSGIALTLKNAAGAALTTGNSSTAVELVTATGHIFQIHQHNFPAFDMYTVATDKADIVNQPTDEGGGYETTTDLVTDITHYVDGTAAGVAIGVNKYFNLVIWGVMNRNGETSFLMINLPTGQYTTSGNAIADVDGLSVFEIPSAFKGVGFLIARLTFRLIGGAQWTYIAQEDLRGKFPDIIAGVGITTTDHTLLANLTAPADDHTQYVLADGTRALAGAWNMGSQALTNVNIDSGVITGITDLAIADGGTGQSTAQAAINALSAVSGATNEHVLTKDTATGNAVFKAAAGGGTPGGATTQVQFNDAGSFGGDTELIWDKTNNKLRIGAASIYTALTNKLEVVGSMTATSDALFGVTLDFDHNGSGAASEYDFFVQSGADSQYTGSGQTIGLIFNNYNKSTGADALGASAPGNFGFFGTCRGITTGDNVGGGAWAGNGNRNYGGLFYSVATKASASNIGIVGQGINAGASSIQCGGYFATQTGTPTFESAGLIADNGTATNPIILGRDNGTTVFSVIDGGNVGIRVAAGIVDLDVRSTGTNVGSIAAFCNSDASDWISFYSGRSGDQAARIFWDSGEVFELGTTTSPTGTGYVVKLTIDSSGNTVIAGTLTVNGDQSGATDHVFDDFDDIKLLHDWRDGKSLPFKTGDLLNRDRLLRDTIIQLHNRIKVLEKRNG